MPNLRETTDKSRDEGDFYRALENALGKIDLTTSDICNENNPVEKRILQEYGAVFLTTATPPSKCMFTSADQVVKFQKKIVAARKKIADVVIELQSVAMEALLKALDEAQAEGLKITPRDGGEAAKRSFADTLRLWKSRFEPACEYWKGAGKLTEAQINRLKSLAINEQVREVLELEKQKIFFNKTFTATILSSVAAPGTSQHLSMLAFDAAEFSNPKIRKIMGNHGWFRTVKGDAPHFTYLGVPEEKLNSLGLKIIETRDGEFWIPQV